MVSCCMVSQRIVTWLRSSIGSVGLALALTAAFGTAPALAEKVVPESREQVNYSYAPLIKQVAPAVVNIYTKRTIRQSRSMMFDDPVFKRFFEDRFSFGPQRDRQQSSLGSGVMVGEGGVVVTNRHVINGADEITVVLSDRREFDARIILSDERSDLAVLQIDAEGEDLPYLAFENSDDIEVGDLVFAIGNPFGVGQTVTSGIVSAVARTEVGTSDYEFFIQTDAAINPGNSGGALVGLDGKLYGVNTVILSRSGGSHGVGFAIPANMVAHVVESALTDGKVIRPWLGGSGQQVTAGIAESVGLDRPTGVLVNHIHPKGPAKAAGLQVGDIMLEIGGQEV
ncbi:MAG: trypsin-like peptidase domain-containing protein, partial [Proteobacteria bacterium]|nr:trypsin-like peptidase domain-containing protein [Pseudomonadota bacterium]